MKENTTVKVTMKDVDLNYKEVTISLKEQNLTLIIDGSIINEVAKLVLKNYGIWDRI